MDYRNSLIENNKIIYSLIDEVKKLKDIQQPLKEIKGGNNYFDMIKMIGFLIGLFIFIIIYYIYSMKK
jgi:acid phosphatase family membrane protein YuiD